MYIKPEVEIWSLKAFYHRFFGELLDELRPIFCMKAIMRSLVRALVVTTAYGFRLQHHVFFNRRFRQHLLQAANDISSQHSPEDDGNAIPEVVSRVDNFRYDPKKIRNFSIIAHIGKPSFSHFIH